MPCSLGGNHGIARSLSPPSVAETLADTAHLWMEEIAVLFYDTALGAVRKDFTCLAGNM